MHPSLEFLLDRLDTTDAPRFAAEDFRGPHAPLLEALGRRGLIGSSIAHPLPTCPACRRGAPYEIAGAWRCDRCGSPVPEEHLWVRPLAVDAFLRWFAGEQGLGGGVVRITPECWELGTLVEAGTPRPCFFLSRGGRAEAVGRIGEAAILLRSGDAAQDAAGIAGTSFLLGRLLRFEGGVLSVWPLATLLRGGGRVAFLEDGSLYAGPIFLGRVRPGTRVYWFLDALFRRRGHPVPYEEIQDHIRAKMPRLKGRSGAMDFCQKLRNRLKRQGIRAVDELVVSLTYHGCYLMPRELSLVSEA